MEITILGSGSMQPTKERNHQAIFISHKDEGILVDCGEGTQRQFRIADIKPTKITKIFITHWHGDHTLGLPGLLQTLNASEYEKKLEIYGPKGTKKAFEYMFKTFSFGIGFEHKISEISDDKIELKDIIVNSMNLEHSVTCLGYSFNEKDKRRIKLSYVKSFGIPQGPLLGKLQLGNNIKWKNKIIESKKATYLVKGKKIAIALDTIPCKNLYSLAKDSDIFICESSYTSDLIEKAEKYKHMTALQAAQMASQSNVKKLILTHFSQRYKSDDKLLEDAKMVFQNTIAAFDFMKARP